MHKNTKQNKTRGYIIQQPIQAREVLYDFQDKNKLQGRLIFTNFTDCFILDH